MLKSLLRDCLILICFILVTASQHVPQGVCWPQEWLERQNSSSEHLPTSFFCIQRSGYSLAYDARHKNPHWVYEHLTAEGLRGNIKRHHFDFLEDDRIPLHLRVSPADYRGSGFDKGHMAPAADHRSTAEKMGDTFIMSNICPQCPKFNQGYWANFEMRVRDLTKRYQHVYVITGPLYLPNVEADGKRYVKYQVIGPSEVAVPTHFFKVIILENGENGGGEREVRAYILPNEEISNGKPLDDFETTIEKVERACGFVLAM